MKDSRKYETIVGIFVVASMAVLLIMVFIIARQEGLFQQYVTYRAIFKNVSGLKIGSEVHLAGVTVGNVREITISREGSTMITFHVIKKYSDRVRADSQASIGYMGLLGDKSLDLTTGSTNKPAIPPDGWVSTIEPLDITQMLAKAGPSLEDLQKILHNLAEVTGGMTQGGGDLKIILEQVRQIVSKVNEGKGTLGLLVNDSSLYKETTQTVGGAKKFVGEMDKSLFGKGSKAQETFGQLSGTVANAHKAANNLQEATSGLPNIMKKADSFLDNLGKAGKSLPDLISQAETTVSDIGITSRAAQKSWLLRRHVPQPQEHTILMDSEAGKK